MFTGIIQEIGVIKKIESRNEVTVFMIQAPKLVKFLQLGSSISVDGTCLTVVSFDHENFNVEAIPETLRRSVAQFYEVNTEVNLETPLKLDQGLDGHLVTGHVDFRAKVLDRISEKDTALFTIELPVSMAKYVAMKGSVTVNGVSLTVSKLEEQSFEVSIIPHTLQMTNLGKLQKDHVVNVEVDIIARYLENLLKAKDQQITRDFLRERGFI